MRQHLRLLLATGSAMTAVAARTALQPAGDAE